MDIGCLLMRNFVFFASLKKEGSLNMRRNKILKTRLGAARGLLSGMKDAIATMDSILSESYRADTAGLLIAPWP